MIKQVQIIVFGSTGDLMKRKLIPAFGELMQKGTINKDSSIIALGRREFNSKTYKDFLSEEFPENRILIESLPIEYIKLDVNVPEDFKNLAEILDKDKRPYSEIIFYLATRYELFPSIINGIIHSDMKKKDGKVVLEKPFGFNGKSYKEISEILHKVFSEDKIYRIDHYIAKEAVQKMLHLKLNYEKFDKLISNKFLDSVSIISDEEIGVGNRIEYYHKTGALKDMVQNHLLQLLSLILLDSSLMKEKGIHEAKRIFLDSLIPSSPEKYLFGQYSSYYQACTKTGLNHCHIETFAMIDLMSSLQHLEGVKINIRTGKKMPKKYIGIKLKLKEESILPEEIKGREISVNIYPEASISEPFKLPDIKMEYKDEYAYLLSEVILSNNKYFVSNEELVSSWKIIDEIEKESSKIPFSIYKDGSYPDVESKPAGFINEHS